jgi:hypothetical protein
MEHIQSTMLPTIFAFPPSPADHGPAQEQLDQDDREHIMDHPVFYDHLTFLFRPPIS